MRETSHVFTFESFFCGIKMHEIHLTLPLGSGAGRRYSEIHFIFKFGNPIFQQFHFNVFTNSSRTEWVHLMIILRTKTAGVVVYNGRGGGGRTWKFARFARSFEKWMKSGENCRKRVMYSHTSIPGALRGVEQFFPPVPACRKKGGTSGTSREVGFAYLNFKIT